MPRYPSRSDRTDTRTPTRGIVTIAASRCPPRARCDRMKREGLLRHLRRYGCVLRREVKEHALWENPQTSHAEAVPLHAEIANVLAKRICRRLSIPDPPGQVEGEISLRALDAALPRVREITPRLHRHGYSPRAGPGRGSFREMATSGQVGLENPKSVSSLGIAEVACEQSTGMAASPARTAR